KNNGSQRHCESITVHILLPHLQVERARRCRRRRRRRCCCCCCCNRAESFRFWVCERVRAPVQVAVTA
ncbi:unnamed protein product, partial [Scytosiphon promiscuus]